MSGKKIIFDSIKKHVEDLIINNNATALKKTIKKITKLAALDVNSLVGKEVNVVKKNVSTELKKIQSFLEGKLKDIEKVQSNLESILKNFPKVKAAAKKTTTKKTTAKKVATKKAPVRKATTTKKVATKKAPAKKATKKTPAS